MNLTGAILVIAQTLEKQDNLIIYLHEYILTLVSVVKLIDKHSTFDWWLNTGHSDAESSIILKFTIDLKHKVLFVNYSTLLI